MRTQEQIAFYKKKVWQKCRNNYVASVGGLCERCLERGIAEAGVIVHHKIHITSKNVNNPDITLNWDNLQLLCRKCHGEVHESDKGRRYRIDENGNVIL